MVLNMSTCKGPFILLDLVLLGDLRWLWSLDHFFSSESLSEFSSTDICSVDIVVINLVVHGV